MIKFEEISFIMWRKNASPIIFLIIIVLLVLGYFIYPKLAKSDADTWSMIPDETALILQIDNPSDFIDKVKSEEDLWKLLSKSGEIKKMELIVDAINDLFFTDKTYHKLLFNSPLTISFKGDTTTNSTDVLFLSRLNYRPAISELKGYLTNNLSGKYAVVDIVERKFGGLKILDTENDKTYYLSFIDGVMLISGSLDYLSDAVNTYKSNTAAIYTDSELVKVRNTAGTKVDARLFINYKQLTEFLSTYVSNENINSVIRLASFASWTELDLIVKNDELLLSGFTSGDSSSFLWNIKDDEDFTNKIYNIVPFNTNILLCYNFNDFANVSNSLKTSSSLPSLNYDLEKLKQYLGGSIAYGCAASNLSGFENQSFAIVNFKDKSRGEAELKKLTNLTNANTRYNFNSYTIRQINNPKLLSAIFGNAFSPIKNNHYFFLGDYAIFANSSEMLIKIIQMYDSGKTLDLNDNFKSFSDNLSSEENISLFIRPAEIINMVAKFANKETALTVLSESEMISGLHGASFQYSNDNGLFFTNFYLKLGNKLTEENLAKWKIQLDAEIAGKPTMVKDHTTNRYLVFCYDKNSNIYLISNDGQLLWKKKIDKIPLGEIHQVDFFNNGKIQYLFNTEDYVYLIDKNGDYVKGYPRKLNPAATNSLNVFDYNNRNDYRVLISQADKKTYNYDIEGHQIKGWDEPHSQNIVNETVKRVVANNKDYILITDIDNNTIIVNRRGKERIKIKGNFRKARNSGFYVNRTNSKGIILTTNEDGKLTYIKSSGRLDQTDFGNFSENHFFLYEDFNEDNSVDFIFVDGRDLKVYDKFKKQLFSYKFNNEIRIKPVFFNISHRQSVLGVVSDQEKTIYLFDNKGNTIISRGLVSETPFTVGSLNNNNELNLITASGNTLYNYSLN
ncbi:MAG: hypothetical protein C0595_13195 [Marinilabiliales bacterium]|nr:MAG: hypothetical protein C0595_13195 [Marinilabiliales bacterium]